MKQQLLTIVLVLFACFSQAQTNLIYNASFELNDTCPSALGQIAICKGWSSPCIFTPDYYYKCTPTYPSPPLIINQMYQPTHDGIAYIGLSTAMFFWNNFTAGSFNVREYAQGKLIQPLQVGHTYQYNMYVSATADYLFKLATNNMGALFTTWPIANDSLPIGLPNPYAPSLVWKPQKPQINCSTIIMDTVNWTLVSGTFIADSAYTYVTIGNFYTDKQTLIDHIIDTVPGVPTTASQESYYLIDDLSLIDLNWDATENITNRNTIALSPNPATETITINSYKAYDAIKIIDNMGRVQYSNVAKGAVPVSQLPNGIYLLQLYQQGSIVATQRFVKQ